MQGLKIITGAALSAGFPGIFAGVVMIENSVNGAGRVVGIGLAIFLAGAILAGIIGAREIEK